MTAMEKVALFCNNSSLRGVGKIVKSPTRFLKIMWAIYVLLMVIILFICVITIVNDYFEYKTIIQTDIIADDETQIFPAFTFCNHHPFSENAIKYWESGEILSPTQFSQQLRNYSIELINKNEPDLAEMIARSDTKRVFYQNLPYNHSVTLSHGIKDVFLFCIVGFGNIITLGEYGNQCQFIIKQLSSPSYFNCFQIQTHQDYNLKQDFITLVLHVSHSINLKYQEGFVNDIFDQAYGIRLHIHENNTLPDLSGEGIHIEPGKMIEVTYNTIHWKEAGTPKDICLREDIAHTRMIKDLNQYYNYSLEGCLKMEMGNWLLRKCRCYLSDFLRTDFPNSTHPYCGSFEHGYQALLDRLACLSQLDIADKKKELSKSLCLKRCSYSTYPTFISQTRWRPTDWQVHWLLKQFRWFRTLKDASKNNDTTSQEYKTANKSLIDYLASSNLSSTANQESYTTIQGDYSYVTIRRQNRNSVVKKETLSLGLSALFSRVGGLCSLFLGLTCAFCVEIVEFYLLHREVVRKTKNVQLNNDKTKQSPIKHSHFPRKFQVYPSIDNDDENESYVRCKIVMLESQL